MNIRTRIRPAIVAVSLFAALGGVTSLGCAAASASPSSTITVQDQDAKDGAGVDGDGTQGEFHQATDGTTSGPIMNAVPQYRAK